MTTERKIKELRNKIREAAKDDSPEKYFRTIVHVDKGTGVEYLVLFTGKFTGICPRYNTDGTLKINEDYL